MTYRLVLQYDDDDDDDDDDANVNYWGDDRRYAADRAQFNIQL